MGKYTLRLEEVCNYLYNNQESVLNNTNFNNEWGGGFNTELPNPFENEVDVDTIISSVRTKIFDFTYPLPNDDEQTKINLETKIIKHYYMQEIGFETWGRFKLALNERMNLIMPYFNELYKSIKLQGDNPLTNLDIKEIRNITTSNTNEITNNGSSSATSKEVFQDTPTSQIGNTDYATNITNSERTNTNENTSNGKADGTEDMNRVLTGLSGYSKQDMIQRYRENILNVDEAIINELYDLFMLIY